VYYADNPERKVFRRVYPSEDDSELDDPQWTTLGCDPTRMAILDKVSVNSDDAISPMNGTP
jgi:hypothetical protein